jgi:hypothetical protein
LSNPRPISVRAEAEQLAAVAERLPRLLRGDDHPRDATERLAVAQVCYNTARYAAAARSWAEALEADPRLGEVRQPPHRYNAACAAAMAGSGAGQDADKLDDKERARLRRQALDWLRADREAWGRQLDKEPDKTRAAAAVTRVLQHWLVDTDFASVRGQKALAKLPEAEREPWQKLWDNVANTLAVAQADTMPEKKSGAK